MDSYESLSHTKWECKYRVVFIRPIPRAEHSLVFRDHPRRLDAFVGLELRNRIVTHVFNSWEAMPPVSEQMALPGSGPGRPEGSGTAPCLARQAR
jgi:hypothetical protein